MPDPDFVPDDDIEMTVSSVEFATLGYHTEASLLIQPRRGRYVGTFWDGEEREVAWEPAELERQQLGVKWAFHNPVDAILDLMKIDIHRRKEEGLSMDYLTDHAYRLLKHDPDILADAREGASVGNTVVGSIMSLTTKSPRWATEQAVRDALERIDAEGHPK